MSSLVVPGLSQSFQVFSGRPKSSQVVQAPRWSNDVPGLSMSSKIVPCRPKSSKVVPGGHAANNLWLGFRLLHHPIVSAQVAVWKALRQSQKAGVRRWCFVSLLLPAANPLICFVGCWRPPTAHQSDDFEEIHKYIAVNVKRESIESHRRFNACM